MITCPLALSLPAICEGLGVVTRFNATAAEFGWLNCTCAWLPILKVCQLIAARWLAWLMVVVLPLLLIEALPPNTLPPVGSAFGAGCASAGKDTTTATVAHRAR